MTCANSSERQRAAVAALNSRCFCVSLDQSALRQALASELAGGELFELVSERCPHLFASSPVFVARDQLERMANVIRAIESVVAMPAYRQQVLARAPEIARFDPGAKGVFFGYDFHVADQLLGLIEINTNAGGAMLNLALARAQRACCAEVEMLVPTPQVTADWEAQIVAMFEAEWRLSGNDRPLRSIAIVDQAPMGQYLYPEFLLFQQLFQRQGWQAVIADPSALTLRADRLYAGELAIDLVYNRLTDFLLEQPDNTVLRQAYLQRAAVLTPHPHAHALYADKRNLALLSDAEQLRRWGVPEDIRSLLLSSIPATEIVGPDNAERLWRERRHWFFKPTAGFGSRAAYRGDKLTQRVWQEILAGDYVAQALILPGQRTIADQPSAQVLKFDLRDYVYDGAVQWIAARLYRGQTTNFRTPGGGFAPVYQAPELLPVNSSPVICPV